MQFSTIVLTPHRSGIPQVELDQITPFLLTGLMYGGVHLLALLNKFQSSIIRMLWIVASAMTTVAGALFELQIRFQMIPLVMIPLPAVFGVAIISRAFLLIWSIVELSQLPASAFETPHWSQYIPGFD